MDRTILSAFETLLESKLSNIQNEYLDIQGVCFLLGVSKSTVHKLNHRNAIAYFKPNNSKKCYYKRQDVIDYMTQNRLKSKQEINEEALRFLNERKESNHD